MSDIYAAAAALNAALESGNSQHALAAQAQYQAAIEGEDPIEPELGPVKRAVEGEEAPPVEGDELDNSFA